MNIEIRLKLTIIPGKYITNYKYSLNVRSIYLLSMIETISNTCQGHCNQYLNISIKILFRFKVYEKQNVFFLNKKKYLSSYKEPKDK